MGTEEVERRRSQLVIAEKERLDVRRDAVGGDRLAELALAREELHRYETGADRWSEIATWREENGLAMTDFNFEIYCAESDELIELRKSGLVPTEQLAKQQVTRELGRWLKKLHATLVAYPDHIEVSGRINFDVPFDDDGNEPRKASYSGRGMG